MLETLRASRDLVRLRASIVYVTLLITMNSLLTRERMSHENGVAASGRLRIVDALDIPEHDFFVPGREFDVRLRHATVLYRDDAMLTVRGASLKFANTRHEAPLDLLMNSGRVGLFFDARTFRQFMRGTMKGRGQNWLPYLTKRPQAMFGGGDSVRRNPESFARLSYNSKTCFGYTGVDGQRYYARYRLVPATDWTSWRDDSGLPSDFERSNSWFQNPLPHETRHRNYLKDEYRQRLEAGPVEYRLQIQVRERPPGPDPAWVANEYEWEEEETPWSDLAAVSIDTALSHEEAQRTWFSIANHPPTLPVPRGTSIDDPHSLMDLRLASDSARKARLMASRWRGVLAPPGDSRYDKDWVSVPPMADPPGD